MFELDEVSTIQPDWRFLDEVIGNIKNIEKKNMYQVVKEIYEATYFRYAIKYHEEKGLREKYEKKVIEKVGRISELENKVAALTHIIETLGQEKLISEDYLKDTGFKAPTLGERFQAEGTKIPQRNS